MMLRILFAAVAPLLVAGTLHAESKALQISLKTGWNAVAFPTSLKQSDLPRAVDTIVTYENDKSRLWRSVHSTKTVQPPKLIDKIQQQVGDLEEGPFPTLAPYHGCLIYCNEEKEVIDGKEVVTPVKISLSTPISVDFVPKSFPAKSWVLRGLPVGSYGDHVQSANNGFSPPNEAPLVKLLDLPKTNKLDVRYLEQQEKGETKSGKTEVTATWKWKPADLSGTQTEGNQLWRLRQSEAVWIHVADVAEVQPTLSVSTANAEFVEVPFGASAEYVDLNLSAHGSGPCMFRFQEADWFFSSNVPAAEDQPEILKAATVGSPGPGFVKLDSDAIEPEISYTYDAGIVPYLESSHGPWSDKRAVRINTRRMTKESTSAPQRILQPGFYVGQLDIESNASNSADVPRLIVAIEVPELFGGYEGHVLAQVLSVRKGQVGTEQNPLRSFLTSKIKKLGGGEFGTDEALPFSEMFRAARPGATSIEIGKFPIRLRLMRHDSDESKIKATFLQRGSFIFNGDEQVDADYLFSGEVNGGDFFNIAVALEKTKKTVFVSHDFTKQVSHRQITKNERREQVPIMVTPVVTPEGEKDPEYKLVRNIRAVLQEQASGYLRGIFVDAMGGVDGAGLVRSFRKNPTTGKVSSEEQTVYVVAQFELFRVTTEQGEILLIEEEKKKAAAEADAVSALIQWIRRKPLAVSALALGNWQLNLSGFLPATIQGQISGVVQDQNGSPVPAANVSLFHGNNTTSSVRCDESGNFTVVTDKPPNGNIQLTAGRLGFGVGKSTTKALKVEEAVQNTVILVLDRPAPVAHGDEKVILRAPALIAGSAIEAFVTTGDKLSKVVWHFEKHDGTAWQGVPSVPLQESDHFFHSLKPENIGANAHQAFRFRAELQYENSNQEEATHEFILSKGAVLRERTN